MTLRDVTITLDQGNSSTKLVVYDATSREEISCATLIGATSLKLLSEQLDGCNVIAAIGCNVAHDRNLKELMETINSDKKIELTHLTPVPLKNGYGTPETLGADRLAAAVGAAAIHPGKDILVADMGSACTFDIVSAEGEFKGGNISPGPGMRLRALNRFTARLPLVSGHSDTLIPNIGNNTEEALRCGALRGVVAELLYYSGNGQTRQLVLSGGWAPKIAALLPNDITYSLRPHLVNEGLNHILHYNLER